MLPSDSPCKLISEETSSVEIHCPCGKYKHFLKRGDDGELDYHYVVMKKPAAPAEPMPPVVKGKGKKKGFFLFDKVDIGKKPPKPVPREDEEEEEEEEEEQ